MEVARGGGMTGQSTGTILAVRTDSGDDNIEGEAIFGGCYNDLKGIFEKEACRRTPIALSETSEDKYAAPVFKALKKVFVAGQMSPLETRFLKINQSQGGEAEFVPKNNHWGFSSTGYAWDAKPNFDDYITTNVSTLTMNGYELYTKAHRSSLSLTYYGRCLANGNYTMTLYFAKIVFRDSRSFQSLGRRLCFATCFDTNTLDELGAKEGNHCSQKLHELIKVCGNTKMGDSPCNSMDASAVVVGIWYGSLSRNHFAVVLEQMFIS
ncbi:probable leucine-rich repeat receptor-like serine/threonine-protein kinase isoform X1 [Tanacetum coccineum]|uniref:Probable leucine-rich repeat receptor-like serine/threonine-protein kinase isoform X1 n=1 Tax=Tanacetum coccineum TaxID=301880 RepID=A0ABQ5JBY7_9ASTR